MGGGKMVLAVTLLGTRWLRLGLRRRSLAGYFAGRKMSEMS